MSKKTVFGDFWASSAASRGRVMAAWKKSEVWLAIPSGCPHPPAGADLVGQPVPGPDGEPVWRFWSRGWAVELDAGQWFPSPLPPVWDGPRMLTLYVAVQGRRNPVVLPFSTYQPDQADSQVVAAHRLRWLPPAVCDF